MKPARKFAIFVGVLVIAAIIYFFISAGSSSGLELIGTVDANQVIVSARITGRIEKLYVEEGAQVKQGDLIAKLDTAELAAQQQATAAAVASLRSQVSGSQATEQATSGTTTSDVTNAEAQLAMARANLAQTRADLTRILLDTRRTDQLATQGVASQQDKDAADANLRAQQARVRAASDQVTAGEAALKAAQARLHTARAAANTVAATRAQQLQAQAQNLAAQAQLDYTNVYAPVSGTVSVRAARAGEVVTPGEPIVTLVDFSETWVRASIPETDADAIGVGDKLNIRLPGGDVVSGTVITKAAEADFATQRDVSRRKRDIRTIGLKLEVPNPERTLVPGMTATVLIPQAKLKGK